MHASSLLRAALALALALASHGCTPPQRGGSDEQLADARAELARAAARMDQASEDMSKATESLERALAEQHDLVERLRAREPDARPPDLRDPFAGTRDADAPALDLTAGVRCDAARCRVSRALVNELLANPRRLSGHARVLPVFKDGEMTGLKLYGIREGTLPRALGFRNGDAITSVNDKPLRSIDRALAIYTELRDAKVLVFRLRRDDAQASVTVEIDDEPEGARAEADEPDRRRRAPSSKQPAELHDPWRHEPPAEPTRAPTLTDPFKKRERAADRGDKGGSLSDPFK